MSDREPEGRLRASTFPVVLAGPSGSGKTTVGRAVERLEDVRFSVSATTRPRRTEEEEGVDYRFLDREVFEELRDRGELLEWAEVHDHLYGTPRSNLTAARREGRHLLLDIDVQGARSVRRKVPEVVTVFLVPPDGGRVVRRLRGRGTEGEEEIRRRLDAARKELAAVDEFDYVVVNDVLEEAVGEVESIIRAEERRIERMGTRVQEEADALAEEIVRVVEETGSAPAGGG